MEENLEVIGLRMFIIIDFGRNRFRCERGLRASPEARVVEKEEKKEEEERSQLRMEMRPQIRLRSQPASVIKKVSEGCPDGLTRVLTCSRTAF